MVTSKMKGSCYPELMPWEPIITGFKSYTAWCYTPEPGDICEECGKDLTHADLITTNPLCCDWECALVHAGKYPKFYTIQERGAY